MKDVGEFRKNNPPQRLANRLPNRPVSNLRDIQYLYGLMYQLATPGGGEHGAFLSPDAASDLLGEEESVVAVNADLRGDEPELGDPPIHATKYVEELVPALAHSKYPAARGIDHSITHQSGQNSSPNKLAGYAVDRLTDWPSKKPVSEVADTHEDGWIIEALAELGADDQVRERIRSAVEQRLGGPRTALVTVRVQTDDRGYRWPGELEVFQDAMRARKVEKLASKGPAEDATGSAVDLLTGEDATTVGTSEDPLRFYLSKQKEKFPGLDAERAWQAHPVSEEGAVTIENAGPLLDPCTYTTFGATVYYLPYIHGQPTPQDVYDLYGIVSAMAGDAGEEHATPIERAYREIGETIDRADLDLRFYVAAVAKQQMSRWDVFGETLNGSIVHPVDLAQAHRDVLESTLFSQQAPLQQGRSPPLRTVEDWALLDVENENAALGLVATGRYFYETFPDVGEDGDAAADDPRIQALVSVLGGEPLVVADLIASYAERLVAEEGDSFPSYTVNSQYAQLQALAGADLLRAETARGEPLTEPFQSPNDPTMSQSANTSSAKQRDEKLEAFLERSPALADDPERRSSFLLGALVGHVSSYQQGSNVSLTVVDQHPVGGLTKTNVKRRTQEMLGKNIVYSREEGYGSTMYAEVVDRLRESILETDPSEWKLPLEDLRFYYALGVSYGMNDYRTQQEDSSVEVEAIQES
jgi:CRISPR-associated protein Cas8b/Csh1 subtype I-B